MIDFELNRPVGPIDKKESDIFILIDKFLPYNMKRARLDFRAQNISLIRIGWSRIERGRLTANENKEHNGGYGRKKFHRKLLSVKEPIQKV